MTRNKWLIVVLAVSVVAVGVYHWVSTAPEWSLYHKYYGNVTSVEEFDSLMSEVETDAARNFMEYPIDSSQIRQEVASRLGTIGYDQYGQLGYIESFGVDVWAWVWEGSGMNPDWEIVDYWRDTWRRFNYSSPEVLMNVNLRTQLRSPEGVDDDR